MNSHTFRFTLLLLFTVVFQLVCQPSFAQTNSQFTKFAPAGLDSTNYRPEAFALGDLNGDGFEDLVINQTNNFPTIFLYNPDSLFFDFDHPLVIETPTRAKGPINVIDANGDGLNELIIGFNLFEEVNRIYNLEKDSTFSTLGNIGALSLTYNSVYHWAFGDFNKDGKLDGVQGFQTTRFATNSVFSNVFSQNNTIYERISDSPITDAFARTLSSYLLDFNKDGFLDYWMVNTLESSTMSVQQDFFYRGGNSGFTEVGASLLSGYTISTGAAIGDPDNDGDLDIYQLGSGATRPNTYFRNIGDLEFETDATIFPNDVLDSRNAYFGDIDNDGDQDLVIAEFNGSGGQGAYPSLYENMGKNASGKITFTKRIVGGLPELNSLGFWRLVTLKDINRDGFLDILLMGGHTFEPVVIFQNKTNTNRWLALDLELSNGFYREAFGAKVTVEATIFGESVLQYRELSPLNGQLSQHSSTLHFGMGNASSAKITIEWPSGSNQVLNLTANDLNKFHTITEPVAGKIVFLRQQPYQVIANLREPTRDTLYFINIGEAPVTVNSMNISNTNYTIESYSTSIASQDTGFVALQLFSDQTADLGRFNDTLMISSTALNGSLDFLLSTFIRTQPAQFELVEEGAESFSKVTKPWLQSLVGDVNFSGNQDIFLLAEDEPLKALMNNGENEWVYDPQNDSGIWSTIGRTTQHLAAGDVNHDGFLDFFLANESIPNQLILSNPDQLGNYAIAEDVGLASSLFKSPFVLFHDINKDSWLDIIVANTNAQRNELYLNRRNGTFLQIRKTDDALTSRSGFTSYILAHDFDNDGDDDLLLAETDHPNGDRITYLEQTEDLYFEVASFEPFTTELYSARGFLLFDYNNDGLEDLLMVSNRSDVPSRLYEQSPDGSYTSVLSEVFSQLSALVGDALVFDYNSDGYLDLYFTNTSFSGNNILLQSTGGQGFLNVTAGDIVEMNKASTQSATIMDSDLNGRPDLLINQYFGLTQVFSNQNEENNWIGIKAFGAFNTGRNQYHPGTKVTVNTTISGTPVKLQRVIGRNSLYSPSIIPPTFGIGDATSGTYDIVYSDTYRKSGSFSTVNGYIDAPILGVSIDEPLLELPSSFSVDAAFPNPFNPRTNLQLNFPTSGTATIQVFDLLGRKVSSLVLEKSAGIHTVQLGESNWGSGMYIVHIQGFNTVQTQKITLIK